MGPLRLLPLALLGALSLAAPAQAAVEEEIIVKRAPGLTAAERADVRADADVEFESALRLPRVELVRAEPGERAEALAALNADPDVIWAEPNRERRIATSDSLYGLLWGLENTGQFVRTAGGTPDADIDAPEAWATSRGHGVTVAVMDTGVQPDHPDLSVLTGENFVDGDSTTADGHGHGTHVAGTIAALENVVGVVGVAPEAQILPVRVLDDDGSGSVADVAQGFDWAGDEDVRIVNASLGSSGYSQLERDAIGAHPNTLFVVSAGNGGPDGIGDDNDVTPTYPCRYNLPNILCVGASDQDDVPAGFSNFGDTSVDLFAPGTDIASTWKSSSYVYSDGTSMASPHVAGAAALLAASAPGAGPALLVQALLAGADAKPALGCLAGTGARLNAAAALTALASPDTAPPAAPAGLTATGSDGEVGLDWADNVESDLAGYRVYAQPDVCLSAPTGSGHTHGGLVPGTTYSYVVTAVDEAGNESPPAFTSATTAAPTAAPTITAPPAVAPPAPAPLPSAPLPSAPSPSAPSPSAPSSPPPPSTGGSGGAIWVMGARVSGRIVVCRKPCRPRRGKLAFTLGAAAPVRVTLARRSCRRSRCAFATTGARTLRLPRGRRSLTIGRTVAGMKLRPGTWRVTLATTHYRTSASFKVHAR